jgi:membrane-associated phospholipid phosphatase
MGHRMQAIRSMAAGIALVAAVPLEAQSAVQGIELSGDLLVLAAPVVVFGMNYAFKDGEGAMQYGKSAALAMGTTYVLKLAIESERPDGSNNQSFPSGHATLSFCSAEFMRKRYGWKYGLPAYAVATYVTYTRVEAEKHYTRDVLAGAAIGIASSWFFTTSYKGWSVEPQVAVGYYGVRVVKGW